MDSKQKKIIWIINQAASWRTIADRQINTARFLMDEGYSVFVVCGSEVHHSNTSLIEGDEQFVIKKIDDVPFLILKSMKYRGNGVKRVLSSLKFQKDVLKVSKQIGIPDVVISNFIGLFGNRLLWFKRKCHSLFISDILDPWPETFVDMGYLRKNSLLAKFLYHLEKKGYEGADYCFFSFEGGSKYIQEKKWDISHGGSIDLKKIRYMNNGINLEDIEREKNVFRFSDPDLSSPLFKVIYIGSLSEANDPMLLVKAAEILRKRDEKRILFLIFGDGTKFQEMSLFVKEHKLTNVVLKGRTDIRYAPNILSQGDACVFNFVEMPLLKYGYSPNKLFMYFSSGKPVISTVSCGYELVEQNKCGFLVEHSPDALADGVVRMAETDKECYSAFSRNCLSLAMRFDYRTMLKELLLPILVERFSN